MVGMLNGVGEGVFKSVLVLKRKMDCVRYVFMGLVAFILLGRLVDNCLLMTFGFDSLVV